MITKIIFKLGKYFLAIAITMFLWNYAGQAMTEKDTISNFMGLGVYFIISVLWIWLLGGEFKSLTKTKDGCDHSGCECSHQNNEEKH
jgi:hypothetical protein